MLTSLHHTVIHQSLEQRKTLFQYVTFHMLHMSKSNAETFDKFYIKKTQPIKQDAELYQRAFLNH